MVQSTDLTMQVGEPSGAELLRHDLQVAGQRLQIFVESPPLLDAMVVDIDRAQQRVWCETYIFFNDGSGQRIADALVRASRRGVQVRVLYDAVGSQGTPDVFFEELSAAGIEVHAFHSLGEALRGRFFSILNRRDHRKLLVVDDRIGFFGGMNMVDTAENPAQVKKDQKPISSGWRDVHVRLEGAQQAELAESFDRSWRRAHDDRSVPRRVRSYRRAAMVAGGPEESIRFFDSGPGTRYSRAARVFVRLINAARQSITISMAYFLPVGAVYRALLRARRRGVHVRVIVPQRSDVPVVYYATCHLYAVLLKRDFDLFERRNQMLHAKTMVIDHAYSVVGSCNLDPRSLYINLEFLGVIRSRAFAAAIEKIAADEIAQSDQVTQQTYERRSAAVRLLSWLSWQLRWWL